MSADKGMDEDVGMMMELKSMARRGAGTLVLIAGATALPLAAGMAHIASVAADSPAYPITDPYGDAPIGIVQVAAMPAGDQLTVNVDAALPNTVYSVQVCSTDASGAFACSAPAANGTLTADVNGNGQTTFTLAGSATPDEVELTDPAGHVYTAVVSSAVDMPLTLTPGMF